MVCGSLSGNNNANLGGHLSNIGWNTSAVSVEVGLSILTSFKVLDGFLQVNCATKQQMIQDTGNAQQYYINGLTVIIQNAQQGTGVVGTCTTPSTCPNVIQNVKSLSSALCGQPNWPGNYAGWKPSSTNNYLFSVQSCNSNEVAVFNILEAGNFTNSAIITLILDVSAAPSNLDLVVFNIYGASSALFASRTFPGSVTFPNGNAGSSQTIWNFCDATSVTITTQVFGAVLAPVANLVVSADIDGTVAAQSVQQNNEIHQPLMTFPPCIIS